MKAFPRLRHILWRFANMTVVTSRTTNPRPCKCPDLPQKLRELFKSTLTVLTRALYGLSRRSALTTQTTSGLYEPLGGYESPPAGGVSAICFHTIPRGLASKKFSPEIKRPETIPI
jgi:hypothetical protein